MNRCALVKALEDMGCIFVSHGGRHDWYTNQQSKQSQPVPRHNEINNNLAKFIIKKLKPAPGDTAVGHLFPRAMTCYADPTRYGGVGGGVVRFLPILIRCLAPP